MGLAHRRIPHARRFVAVGEHEHAARYHGSEPRIRRHQRPIGEHRERKLRALLRGAVPKRPIPRRKGGDPPLAGGQRLGARERLAPGATACRIELGPRMLCQRLRAAVAGDIKRGPQRRSSLRRSPCMPQRGPERRERLRVFQTRRGAIGHLDRLVQKVEPLIPPHPAQ